MSEGFGAVIQAGEEWIAYRQTRREERRRRQADGWLYPLPAKEQIEKYAEAFYGLAKLFQDMPCQKERLGDEDMEQLFEEDDEDNEES